jgi:pentatricopeptide repeat protein
MYREGKERAVEQNLPGGPRDKKFGRKVTEVDVLKVTTSVIKKGSWKNALQCLENLRNGGISPDIFVYSAAISACGKGSQAQPALDLLGEMKAAGLKPNVIAYNAAISACGNGGQTQSALDLFGEMKSAGLKPDIITYNAVISACERGGQPQRSQSLLKSAVADGVFKSTLGYNVKEGKLNLHVNSVYVEQSSSPHEPCVSADVAKALFQHAMKEGRIQNGTCLVVGRHGDNLVKDAIKECLAAAGMSYIHDVLPIGCINEGRLIAVAPPLPKQYV